MGSIRCTILAFVCLVGTLQDNLCSGEKVLIVHWNDVGAQMERFHPGTSQSSAAPAANCNSDTCVGGLSNLIHYINQTSESEPDIPTDKVFRLTSGNLVSGENGWLSVIGWEKYGVLIDDFYKPTAMSLGVKDFGAGLDRTLSYLNTSKVSNVVITNVVCPTSSGSLPDQKFCAYVTKMRELTPSLGLLGFVNPDVMLLGSPGSLKFEDIVTSLTNEVNKHPSINAFIAIGDGNLETSKRILEAVPKVKLVIYGMGFGASKDMAGNYPMKHGNGYIATAGQYGSTIGKIVLDINANGNVEIISGSTKLIPTVGLSLENATSLRVNEFAREVEKFNDPIGQTIFKLEGGKRCWRQECNLGNLVTDAMVHCALVNSKMTLVDKTPVLSLWHGGALFDDQVSPNRSITHLDIHKWLPYHNRAHLVRIQGSNLWEVFQASAKGITADVTDGVRDWGQFLQVSNGLEIQYNTKGKEPVVQKIRILHEEDSQPVMKDIEMSREYYFVIPSIILEGRTVYGFAKNYWTSTQNIDFDDQCLQGYISALNKISIGFEERIWIDSDLPCNSVLSKGGNTAVTVIVTIVIMLVLLGVVYVGYFYVFPKLTGRTPNGFRNFSDA